MLQSIRDRTQGWLAWSIILTVCVTFALWGIHSYNSGTKNVPAAVNGQAISQHQIDAAYERLRRQQQMQLGADFASNPAIEPQLKKQAINQLILSQALTQAAVGEGYRVTSSQVDEALLRMPVFQIDGQFSQQRFQEVLGNISYSNSTFLSDLHGAMLINQVQAGYVDSAFSLPDDVNAAIKLIDQKRDIAYLQIPLSRFLKAVTVPEADIIAYYKQHAEEFSTPEQVSIQYVELSLPALSTGFHATEESLLQFYKDNIDNYKKAERWQVARILISVPADAKEKEIAAARAKIQSLEKRLKMGEDFSKLAQENSNDTESAKKGGILPWLGRQDMVDPTIIKTVSKMAEGKLSAPVKTSDGFNIFKLLSSEKSEIQPFVKVHDQIEKAMAQQQAAQLFVEQSDKLSNLTYVHPETLENAAKLLHLSMKTTEFFTRQGGKTGIITNQKIIAAAFSSDVLARSNNSDVIELSPDTLIVLRVKEHQPAAVRPLAEVQDAIRMALKEKVAKQRAATLAETILKRLQQGLSGKQLAKEYQLEWQFKPEVGRHDASLDTTVLAQAFRMPRPPRSNTFSSAVMAMPNGGFAVLAVTGVHDGVINKSPEAKRRIFQTQIENSFGQLDYELYVRGLIKKAKVVVNGAHEET